MLYELTERFEESSEGRTFLISHTLNAYAPDFSVITSFGFNGLCATDSDTIVRLTEGGPRIGVRNPVRKLVPRIFEREIYCQPKETQQFIDFVEQLMALEQRHYAAAMRAMKTYMSAIVRLADDCELAYTLLVASLESLAQQFDGHRAAWDDYDSSKRARIDKALKNAAGDVAHNVRTAILENEHVALARRFKEFTLAHVDADYFRPDLQIVKRPIGRSQLEAALKHAYSLRSKHVHTLQELPRKLKRQMFPSDYETIDGVPLLTFEGLTRLVRDVIVNFVRRGPKVESETLSPTFMRYGMDYARMSAKYWIGNSEGLQPTHGRHRLEGFLEQYAGVLSQDQDQGITDLSELLREVEKLLQKKMNKELRRPFIALYILFVSLRRETMYSSDTAKFVKTYGKYLEAPSIEGWLVYMLLDQAPSWKLTQYAELFYEYMRTRNTANGQKMPDVLVISMGLQLVELHRSTRQAGLVQKVIADLTDQFPGNERLRKFENEYVHGELVNWRKIMFPSDAAITTEIDSGDPTAL